jgi:3-hydroxyisobutyrate dehydrogenase
MSVYSDPSPVNRPSVTVLGTGLMGAGMARNIASAGLTTRVWNRSRERAEALAPAGITVCSTVGEAVEGAEIVVTMLWDASTVEERLREAAGSLRPGAVLLQTTTVGAEGADRLGRVASDLGLVYVDSPVLGTKGPAEKGTLVVLASGPDDVRQTVAPVLDAIGSRTLWVGPAGAGSRLKLAANAYVLSLTGAVAQSLALTRSFGLDPNLFLEALAGGPLDSAYVGLKGRMMLSGDFTPSFTVAGALKDAEMILADVPDPGPVPDLVRLLRDRQRQVEDAGYGDEDFAAVYRSYTS